VIRKYLLATCLLALPLGTLVASGAAAGASTRTTAPVTFTGSVTCSISGAITAKPPLTLDTPQTTTISLKGTATKCRGKITQGGVKLVSGKISGQIDVQNEDCFALTSGVPNPVGTITWRGKGGRVTPTSFTLSNGAGTFGTKKTTIRFSSAQTGSFAGTGKAKATVKKNETQLINECGSKHGLGRLVVASGRIS
jgi:hypothetical protein